jgi:DNA-binding transcriptional MerR regulator
MSRSSTLAAPVRPEPRGTRDREFTIAEAARLTGLGEHTLRYYERARLLEPVRRQSSSRHRRYSSDDVARLRTLACLRAAGMPLESMRRYFELIERGARAAPLQLEMLGAQREVLQERLRDLEGHLRYLDGKIGYWQAVQDGDRARAAEIAARLSSEHTTRHP